MPSADNPSLALIQRVTQSYLSRDITREEMINVRTAISQHLLPLMDNEYKIFVLGSYGDGEKQYLETVQEILRDEYRNRCSSRARVFLMDDVPGDDIWINLGIKFRLLADISDSIVGVAENDQGGFMFEQGIIATHEDYVRKTHLLKRQYASKKEEHSHYSAMQASGLFDELRADNRLFEWSDTQGLAASTIAAFERIEKGD